MKEHEKRRNANKDGQVRHFHTKLIFKIRFCCECIKVKIRFRLKTEFSSLLDLKQRFRFLILREISKSYLFKDAICKHSRHGNRYHKFDIIDITDIIDTIDIINSIQKISMG